MKISMIVAVAENLVIGKDKDLVWSLPDDMKFFKEKTAGHHVIMGRKNYESIPAKWRPLPNRPNIIISRNNNLSIPNVTVVNSIDRAIDIARQAGETEAFIIGGGEIFAQSMNMAERIYYTEVKGSFEGDTYFPQIDRKVWQEISRVVHPADERHAFAFDFVLLEKQIHEI